MELNVNMHCEACADQLKRKILKMRGMYIYIYFKNGILKILISVFNGQIPEMNRAVLINCCGHYIGLFIKRYKA